MEPLFETFIVAFLIQKFLVPKSAGMLINYVTLDDEQKNALHFRLWILTLAVPALLIASQGGFFNLVVFSPPVIWSIVDYIALTQGTTIYPAISFIPSVICTAILWSGAALFLISGLGHRGNFLVFLVAILFSVAGVLQAIIVVKQGTILVKQVINVVKKAYRMTRGRGSNQGIELPK
ncbi:hypothetical protein N7508_009902 [Penicillium antarcticum]|uniref:uncharacterized protein n=1 Tax=Penicillium antarcticum TaxID=416450 RepID=UPI0023A62C39|nr:uncharacterized protein N7508_009902 [Penicillium antarcticum]KAJ5295081.1 hypothetical protein N7508_009902 [Penicillium antarcticum]